jgi:hypothetical protein
MEELIQVVFFALIVIASLAESGARRRKAQRQKAEEMARRQRAPDDSEYRPEYDPDWSDDPSPWDEDGGRVAASGAQGGGSDADERADSMVPAELWEEIASLARGEVPEHMRGGGDAGGAGGRTPTPSYEAPPTYEVPPSYDDHYDLPAPAPPPEVPESVRGASSDWDVAETRRWALEERSGAGDSHTHAIQHAHKLSEPPRVIRRPARVDSVLPVGDPAALRQAILLREVLGPPRGFSNLRDLPMEE